MKPKQSATHFLLLLTAMIWGFAFVAQRVGMEYIGPYTYNAVRFALGGLSLYPLIIYLKHKNRNEPQEKHLFVRQKRVGGLLLGLVLFSAASLQQVGLQYTTAGKSGFITGLYVVFVPLMGVFFRHKTSIFLWIAVLFAAVGMYLLSVTSLGTFSYGDMLTFFSALFWTVHVLLTGYLSPKMDSIKLAQTQFFVCALLCSIVAVCIEPIDLSQIFRAYIPILYGGLLSVGVAYTLQVVVQKTAHPTYSAVILSLESLFAAIGGWIILNETLSLRSLIGCGLMLAGMMIAQIRPKAVKLY
jgi:drug/metabolite transporter (DMT)-like permease